MLFFIYTLYKNNLYIYRVNFVLYYITINTCPSVSTDLGGIILPPGVFVADLSLVPWSTNVRLDTL